MISQIKKNHLQCQEYSEPLRTFYKYEVGKSFGDDL